ncbi:hypothetical protein MYX07_05185 [Patescibacteria group bacterium AH-259-L07]|nr:hypothetical protein [Patescibacteria group bacterium AH-259-L07]
MYFYIYDSFLTNKKYARTISKIETRVARLGIDGKKRQLTVLKNVKEMVNDMLKHESSTIVIVGGDETFYAAAIPMAGSRAVLGFIPTDSHSSAAHVLGLPLNEYACDVISARRIETVSFGKVNKQYFFSSLEFTAHKVVLNADDTYQIIPKRVKSIKVINLDLLQFEQLSEEPDFKKMASNPKDEYLEVLMGTPGQKFLFWQRKEKRDSLFFVKKLKVDAKNPKDEVKITLDKNKTVKTPAVVELAQERLKVIVGKDRLI